MKKQFILFFFTFIYAFTIWGQTPYQFNYQAVLRDEATTDPLENEQVDVEVVIWKDDITKVYCENHDIETNEFGLLNLRIGEGLFCAPGVGLEEVDWSSGSFKMEVNVTTSNGKSIIGSSPLLAVPFALHAETVTNNDDADPDATNELQQLSIDPSTNKLSLSDGGEVDLSNYVSKWSKNSNGVYLEGSKVGIGTSSPEASLSVHDDVKAQIEFKRGAVSGAIEQNSLGGALRLRDPSNENKIQLRTYGNSYFAGGNVGFGTDQPQRILHAKAAPGTSIVARVESQNTNGAVIDFKDPNTTGDWKARIGGKGDGLTFIAGGSTRMEILANGKIGVNTNDPFNSLDVNGSLGISILRKHDWQDGANSILVPGATNRDLFLRFRRGGGSSSLPSGRSGVVFSYFDRNHFFIHNTSSALLINYSSNDSDNPSLNGATEIARFGGDANNAFEVSGFARATGWLNSSDLRFKKEIHTIEKSLEKVLKLRGTFYEFRNESFSAMNFPEGRQIGVIAQEVEQVFPELVQTNEQGYKSVDYAKFTAVLIEALKEQQAIIDSQRNSINQLEASQDDILDRLEAMENKQRQNAYHQVSNKR